MSRVEAVVIILGAALAGFGGFVMEPDPQGTIDGIGQLLVILGILIVGVTVLGNRVGP